MTWTLALHPDPDPGSSLTVRIGRAISRDIQRGRLTPGARLPGTRHLARQLGVHRNTVVAAYEDLLAQGWLTARPGSGTFVSAELPDRPPSPGAGATQVGYDLPPWQELRAPESEPPRGALTLNGGSPDLRLVPTAALARAWRRALRQPHLLAYGDTRGLPRLRRALASMLAARRGLAVDADGLLVTRGAQMALALIARALVRPGERVAVEALGYPPAWQAFRDAGADLVPLRVDSDGVVVDDLEQALADGPVRLVYVTPHHQFPSMAVLPAARRLRLLELARTHRMVVVEDDYDHEFHFEGPPVRPLGAMAPAGCVLSVGTLSKVLAPGLRMGWVAGPPQVVERLAAHRRYLDRQGDAVTEAAVAELLDDDTIPRHVRRMRRIYARRRDTLLEALERELGGVLSELPTPGGLALWPRVADDIDVGAWVRRCRERGVWFQPGATYAFDGGALPRVRLGYPGLDEAQLEEAARRMRLALPLTSCR